MSQDKNDTVSFILKDQVIHPFSGDEMESLQFTLHSLFFCHDEMVSFQAMKF